MNAIERTVERVAHWALFAGVLLVAFDAVLIMTDVLGRLIFNKPLLGTLEIARNTVPLIIFCQAPATILAGRMLRVSALFSRLSVRNRQRVEATSCVFGCLLFAALIVDMWPPMVQAWVIWEEDGMAGIKLPMAPIRTALTFLWITSDAALLVLLVRSLRGDVPAPALQAH